MPVDLSRKSPGSRLGPCLLLELDHCCFTPVLWEGCASSLWAAVFSFHEKTLSASQLCFDLPWSSTHQAFENCLIFHWHPYISFFLFSSMNNLLLFLEINQFGHREQSPGSPHLLWYMSDTNRHVCCGRFSDSEKAHHGITIRTMKGIPCYSDLTGTWLNWSPF